MSVSTSPKSLVPRKATTRRRAAFRRHTSERPRERPRPSAAPPASWASGGFWLVLPLRRNYFHVFMWGGGRGFFLLFLLVPFFFGGGGEEEVGGGRVGHDKAICLWEMTSNLVGSQACGSLRKHAEASSKQEPGTKTPAQHSVFVLGASKYASLR